MRTIVIQQNGIIRLTVLVWNDKTPDGRDEASVRLESCGFTAKTDEVWENNKGVTATVVPVTVAANMLWQLEQKGLID